MIKNVCAPAVVLGERIVIVGGEFEQRITRLDTNLAPPMEKGSLIDRCCPTNSVFKSTSIQLGECGQLDKVLFSSRSFSLSSSVNKE